MKNLSNDSMIGASMIGASYIMRRSPLSIGVYNKNKKQEKKLRELHLVRGMPPVDYFYSTFTNNERYDNNYRFMLQDLSLKIYNNLIK